MSELSSCILYTLLHILLCYIVIKKKRYTLSVITIIWAISSLAGIIYFLNPFMAFFYNIEFVPFLYLFLCFCISILPFKYLSEEKTEKTVYLCNPIIFKGLVFVIAVCSFEPLVEILVIIVQRGLGGLADVYIESEEGFDPKYFFSFVGRYLFTIEEYLKFIAIPLFFLYLTVEKKKKWILIGLICGILVPTLFSLANGHRFYLITVGLSFLFNYYFFRKKLSLSIKAQIRKMSIIALSLTSIMFVSISISRFGKGSDSDLEGYGATYQFIRYLGESHTRFNSDIWHQKRLTEGKNSWLGYYGNFEKKKQMDIRERNLTTGFTSNVFFTYIGDLCMDYGKITTIVIISLTSLIFCFFAKMPHRDMTLSGIIMINLYANILLFGFTYFIYKNGIMSMVYSLIIAMLIKISTTNNHKINHFSV